MPDIRRTPTLDDCQRPDESPLSFDGRWRPATGDIGWNGYTPGLKLIAGEIQNTGVIPNSTNVSYWHADSFNDNVECWGRSAAGFDLSEGWRLFLNVTQPESQLFSGYEVQLNVGVGGTSIGISRFDGIFVKVPLVFDSATPLGEDEILLFRYDAGALSVWRDFADEINGWTEVLTFSDSNHSFGYIGLGTDQDDNNPGWREFGGGRVKKTQFYRRLRN